MCQTVVYRGKELRTIGALRYALGRDNIVYDVEYFLQVIPGDSCLCCIDVAETAKAAGLVAEPEEGGDPMRYFLRREEEKP